MHFNTPVMDFPITDEKHFAELTGAEYMDSNAVEVTRQSIESLPGAVVLKYSE